VKQQVTTTIAEVPLEVSSRLRVEAQALNMTLGELTAALLWPALKELRPGRRAARRAAIAAARVLSEEP
jgi:hypothetical protein